MVSRRAQVKSEHVSVAMLAADDWYPFQLVGICARLAIPYFKC